MKNLLFSTFLLCSSLALFSQNLQYFVDADATGSNTGGSWANAFPTLQQAVDSANASFTTGIAEIWVAEGTYKPTNQTTPFVLQRNIHIYGGFDGTEFNREDRDFRNNLTIIDGDLNGDDNSNITVNEAARSDNAYNLFKIEGVFVILDGLVLQGANGSDNQSGNRWFFDGSAIFYDLDAYNGEVRNCVIRNNSAIGSISFSWAGSNSSGNFGAGRYRGNEFYNNYSGGTIFRFTCISSASLANPPNHTTIFQNNLIHGNTVSAWVSGSQTSIMWLNSANFNSNNYSGRSYFQDVSQNTFADNTLPANNSSIIRHFQQTNTPASANGGQFLFITDNIFSQNSGVTVMYRDTAAADKENTQAVFWRNLIEDGDSVLAADLGSFNPNVFGNLYGLAPGFTDRGNDDYTITGCDKPGNDRGGSWIITSPTATDFYGNPRTVGITADIGHAEVQDSLANLSVQQNDTLLVATAGYEPYTWADLTDPQNPIVFNDTTNTFAPPIEGDYVVFAGNSDGCGARAEAFFCTSVQVSLSIVADSLVANGTGGNSYTFRYGGSVILDDTINAIPLQGYGRYEVTHYFNSGPIIGPPPPGACVGFAFVDYCGGIPTVSITQNGTTLEASVTDAANYQWYFDGTAISGATSSTIDLSNEPEGDYYVEVSENSCSGTSNTFTYNIISIGTIDFDNVKIYPNPVSELLTVENIPDNSAVRVFDLRGKTFYSKDNVNGRLNISVNQLGSGIYFVQVSNGNALETRKIIVAH